METATPIGTRPDDQALARLRAEFPSHRIWRSVHPDGRLDGWVASLHDPAAGVEPLVIRASAGDLHAALVADRQRAEERGPAVKKGCAMSSPTAPGDPYVPPAEARATAVAGLRERFGIKVWWGKATRNYWALVPDGSRRGRLVEAATPDALAEAIIRASTWSQRRPTGDVAQPPTGNGDHGSAP